MDLQMPGMGGVEAIERIRLLERELDRENTPVIVLTAFASPEEAVALPMNEIHGVVEKPLDVPLLKRTMLAAMTGCRDDDTQASGEKLARETPDNSKLLDIAPALRLLSGRRDFYSMLAGEFFDCSDSLCADFEKAVTTGDAREAARIAHIIKTSAAALGANQLGSLAADLERLAKDYESVSLEHCRTLDSVLSRTLQALRDVVSPH
jgi:CheY-like chemotaxis protein